MAKRERSSDYLGRLVRPARAWPLLRRFWSWVRPHQRYMWTMFAMLIVGSPLALVSPLIVRRVVDDAVERSSREDVFFWGVVLVSMTCLSVLFGLGRGYAKTLFDIKVLRDLRRDLYLHMQRLDLRYYRDQETGYLMSRQVDDVGNLSGVMADAFSAAAVDAVMAMGFTAMLFYIEWRMASGGLVLAVLIFGFQYLISGRLRALTAAEREAWSTVSRNLHQSISGHELIRATALEKREARGFIHTLHGSVRAKLRRDLFALVTNHIFGLLGTVAPTLIVLAGVYLIVSSDFTVGGLFAFFMYLMNMFGAVARVAALNPRLQSSLASLERIYEVFDTAPEITSPPRGQHPARLRGTVRFENVTFGYETAQPVIHDLDLEIPARQMVALVGPSGAGKTTLAHLVPRFYDPDQGKVLIDDHPLTTLDLRWLRSRIGLVPQEIFLFDRTVGENIALGKPGATLAQIRRAARAANALDFIEAMTEGFDTLVGEKGVKLSGGQRQRIAIARELLRDPRILILDEATSSLDAESERLIQEALDTLLAGRTAIVIAHRLSTVIRADRIVVLEAGRIAEQGTHAELLARDGLYSRLYRSQLLAASSGTNTVSETSQVSAIGTALETDTSLETKETNTISETNSVSEANTVLKTQ